MHLFKCSSTQKFAEIIVYNFFISDIGDYYILYILDCSRGCTWDKYSPKKFLDNKLLNFLLRIVVLVL